MDKKEKNEEEKKVYTGSDLMDETLKILKDDDIAKKLPEEQLRKLSKILVKTALKGEL